GQPPFIATTCGSLTWRSGLTTRGFHEALPDWIVQPQTTSALYAPRVACDAWSRKSWKSSSRPDATFGIRSVAPPMAHARSPSRPSPSHPLAQHPGPGGEARSPVAVVPGSILRTAVMEYWWVQPVTRA